MVEECVPCKELEEINVGKCARENVKEGMSLAEIHNAIRKCYLDEMNKIINKFCPEEFLPKN